MEAVVIHASQTYAALCGYGKGWPRKNSSDGLTRGQQAFLSSGQSRQRSRWIKAWNGGQKN
jgi:hypothetical protein